MKNKKIYFLLSLSTSLLGITHINTINSIADTLPINEQSTAKWPITNGVTLVDSDYKKLQKLDFSIPQEFSKEYSATPKLSTYKNLELYIQGNLQDISKLQVDSSNGKPKKIFTNQMGKDTYFKALDIMKVLIDGKYDSIDLKLTIEGVDKSSDETSVAFGVKGETEPGNSFLTIGSGNQIAQRGNFTHMHYQFFKHGTEEPIAVKFHMGFTDIDFNESVKIQESSLEKVYIDYKSKLPYNIEDNMLAVTRDYNNPNDTNDKPSNQVHSVLFDISSPKEGFDIAIATSGHDNKNSNNITTGSKVAPSILATMVYSGTVTTHYVDDTGRDLQDTQTTSDTIGKDYTTNKPSEITKDGIVYELVPGKLPGNASGQYVDGNTDVIYVYKKKSLPIPKENNTGNSKFNPNVKNCSELYTG